MARRPGPQVFYDDDDAPAIAGPQDAPPPPDNDAPGAPPPAVVVAPVALRRSPVARIFWWALGGFIMLAVGLAAYETVAGLLAHNVWLGRLAMLLGAAALGALVILAAREIAALARMKSVEALRASADRAWRQSDRAEAEATLKELERLYAGRSDLDWARERVSELKGDQPDAEGAMMLAEREYMRGLDAAATAAVSRGARLVGGATAILPVALLDAAVVLYVNIRMIREVAQVYDGRSGWLGSWRLLRQVAGALMAAGAMDIGNDVMGAAIGGGAVSKVSRRLGEGMVNGWLTARIGVAAMEVSRPLPFKALPAPSFRAIAAGAIRRAG